MSVERTVAADVDRAVVLNEMGRMLLMFGDRYTASLFFSKSGDLEPLAMKTVFEPHKEEVGSIMSSFSMCVCVCVCVCVFGRSLLMCWHFMLHCGTVGTLSSIHTLHMYSVYGCKILYVCYMYSVYGCKVLYSKCVSYSVATPLPCYIYTVSSLLVWPGRLPRPGPEFYSPFTTTN